METSIQHQFDNEECKDSIDYVYMGWRILVIIIALSVGMLMVYRLIHEVKREYIDYFKIIQYVNIIMHSFFTTLALIIFLCFPKADLYSVKYLYLFDVNTFWFTMINQLCWLTLIMHLREYRHVMKGGDYREAKANILRFEKRAIFALISVYILITWVLFTILILDLGIGCPSFVQDGESSNPLSDACKASLVFQDMLYYSKGILYFVFIVTQLTLFFLLRKYLKRNLYYYYTKTRTSLIIITWVSILSLLTTAVMVLNDFSTYIDIVSMDSTSKISFSNKSRILHIALIVAIKATFYTFVLYNVKNINFRQYLLDVMIGWEIQRYYGSASLFIRRSPIYINCDDLSTVESSAKITGPDNYLNFISSTDISDINHSEYLLQSHGYKGNYEKILWLNKSKSITLQQ